MTNVYWKRAYWKKEPIPFHIPFITLSAFFTLLVVPLVLARCYVRLRVVRSFGIDDHLIVVALVWWLANCTLIVCLAIFGFWRYWATTEYIYNTFAQTLVCTLYIQNTFARTSVVFSFRRLLPKYHTWERVVTLLMIITLAALCIATIFFSAFGCRPFHALIYTKDFMKKIRHKVYRCHAPRVVFFVSGIPNCLLDFIIFLFPFWLIRNASLKSKTRYGLYAVFAFGGLALIISVLRVIFTIKLMNGVNYKYYMTGIILSILECNFIIIAAALPTMTPLYRKYKHMREVRAERKRSSNSHPGAAVASTVKEEVRPDVIREENKNVLKQDEESGGDGSGRAQVEEH